MIKIKVLVFYFYLERSGIKYKILNNDTSFAMIIGSATIEDMNILSDKLEILL